MAVIALDLGGTKLAGALLAPKGKLACRTFLPLAGRQGNAVGELVCDLTRGLAEFARNKKLPLTGIGASVPGLAYPRTGCVWAPNIPGWDNFPLRRVLATATGGRGLPVVIEGDRACYILGEAWRGGARGCRDAIYLSVGTGIGAGILVDGRVVRGALGTAGSIGWLALDRPYLAEYLGCGCFEYHASGDGLAKVARKAGLKAAVMDQGCTDRLKLGHRTGRELSAADVFAAFQSGDRRARLVIKEAIEFWGMGVANLVSLFNPQKIIFGGGVFGPGLQFLDAIHAEARKWAQPLAIKQVKLEGSRLGGDAGLYGAGYLALQASRKIG